MLWFAFSSQWQTDIRDMSALLFSFTGPKFDIMSCSSSFTWFPKSQRYVINCLLPANFYMTWWLSSSCHQCRPTIDKILAKLPVKERRQTVLFSATFPSDIQQLSKRALRPNNKVVDTVGETEDQTAEKVCFWAPSLVWAGLLGVLMVRGLKRLIQKLMMSRAFCKDRSITVVYYLTMYQLGPASNSFKVVSDWTMPRKLL